QLAHRHTAADLRFNVAHSDELAIIGVSRGCEIGVDVEHLREVTHLERIARRFFHPLESKIILDEPASTRSNVFLRCWTGKEAVLKAIGVGITGSLSSFRVPLNEDAQAWIYLPAKAGEPIASRCWMRRLAPCDEYLAAVACVGRQCDVHCFTFHR